MGSTEGMASFPMGDYLAAGDFPARGRRQVIWSSRYLSVTRSIFGTSRDVALSNQCLYQFVLEVVDWYDRKRLQTSSS